MNHDKVIDRNRIPFVMLQNEVVDDETIFADSTEKMVYIVLRRYANENGENAFPSFEKIAKKARCSRSTAIRRIESLIDKGLVSKQTRFNDKGGITSNLYTIEDFHEYVRSRTLVSEGHGGQCHSETAPVSEGHYPSVSVTLYKDSLKNTNDIDSSKNNNVQSPKDDLNERFESIYKLYPKKQGKKRAFAAYKKAIKAGVTDDTITNGIKRYCFMLEVNRTAAQYIKQAGTWFFNEGWNDEYATDGRFRGNEGAHTAGATESAGNGGGVIAELARKRAASGQPVNNDWEQELDDLEW